MEMEMYSKRDRDNEGDSDGKEEVDGDDEGEGDDEGYERRRRCLMED
jgi:hypothetical protein